MSTTFSRLKSHFANWREWELNPIVIKELRQGVRSNTMSGMLMVLLLMLFAGSVMALVGESFQASAMEAGRAMFRSCLSVLAVGGLVFIPLYTGVRLALEKHEADQMFFTPLSSQNLVWGKTLGGVCLTGLFFSVCLPFMAFCNLLRGLDLFTILFTLLLLFVAICTSVLASVAVGAAPAPVIPKLVLGAAFAGGQALFCWKLLLFLFYTVQCGAAPLIMTGEYALKIYTFFITMTVGSMVAYGFCLAFIAKKPRRENLEGNRPQTYP